MVVERRLWNFWFAKWLNPKPEFLLNDDGLVIDSDRAFTYQDNHDHVWIGLCKTYISAQSLHCHNVVHAACKQLTVRLTTEGT